MVTDLPRIPIGATSLVWKLAKIVIVVTDSGKQEKAQCELCKKKFSYSGSSITNITLHLSKQHPKEWNQLANKDTLKQLLLTEHKNYKYNSDSPKHHEITNNIANMITKCYLPISIVYSPIFIKVLHSLNPKYEIPKDKHFKKLILDQYKMKKVNLFFKLKLIFYRKN